MTKWSCFPVLAGKKKKLVEKPPVYIDNYKENGALDLKKLNSSKDIESKVEVRSNEKSIVAKSGKDEKPVEANLGEDSYEGSDERDESPSIKREFSEFYLHDQGSDKQVTGLALSRKNGSFNSLDSEATRTPKTELGLDLIQSGHVSDPGIEREEFWASPILKRSCSAFETRALLRKMDDQLPLKKSRSFQDLQNSNWNAAKGVLDDMNESPMRTPRSADNVMLKKHSSSQVLPSRSKKIWWKLFLWSHRNTHKPRTVKSRIPSTKHTSDQGGGYCSDTLEPSRVRGPSMPESPGSFAGGGRMKGNRSWGNFQNEASGSWPQNQWLAFSTEASSSLARVDEWVSSVHDQTHPEISEDVISDEGISFPPSPENRDSPARGTIWQTTLNVSEDVLHANNVIQSLNSSSSVAHVAGMNLRVIPMMSRFFSLRSINLSGNYIVHITPGALPKGLQVLNLSRNKISTIEGLRDLTRLRVLDLSYNKITRIGQGLSNCILVKELYLAGNKISIVEGLHRLLKLTVLDLSFNKITTAKALGQLVANYNTLLALNLLGNPIQGNVGDEQVRKAVISIIPRLAYLNKQPIKREMPAMDSVAKAARGNSGRASYRKTQKQIGLSRSSSKSNLSRRRNKAVSNKSGGSSLRRV